MKGRDTSAKCTCMVYFAFRVTILIRIYYLVTIIKGNVIVYLYNILVPSLSSSSSSSSSS